MASKKQLEANRRNALKSTGPTSAAGKAASSMNALKTGLHAKSLVLPSEKAADLQQLIDDYYQPHAPRSPEARAYLDDFILCEWELRRLHVAATQAWQYLVDTYGEPPAYPLGQALSCGSNTFSRLQYRLNSTRRARDRAFAALKQLQAAEAQPEPAPTLTAEPVPSDPATPSPQTASPQIGFVPSPAPAPLAPAPQPPLPDAA